MKDLMWHYLPCKQQEFYDMPTNFNGASLSIRAVFHNTITFALYVISFVIYSVLISTSENSITDHDFGYNSSAQWRRETTGLNALPLKVVACTCSQKINIKF